MLLADDLQEARVGIGNVLLMPQRHRLGMQLSDVADVDHGGINEAPVRGLGDRRENRF